MLGVRCWAVCARTATTAATSRKILTRPLASFRTASSEPVSGSTEFQFSFKDAASGKRLTGAQFLEQVKANGDKLSSEDEVPNLLRSALSAALQELDAVAAESGDLKDKYHRSLAETENVRKRGQRQTEDAKVFAIQSFCKDLLEVSDILEIAADAVKQEELQKLAEDDKLRRLHEGVTMTRTVLWKAFAKHGLSREAPEPGANFNPAVHEAVFQVPAERAAPHPSGSVAQVLKVGWTLRDRPVRAAQVGVVA